MDDANKVVEALAGKAVADVIAEGKKKLASVPSGGSAPAAAAPAASGAAAPKGSSFFSSFQMSFSSRGEEEGRA